MSALQRPGPCKVCDGGGDASSHCVGVQIGGDKVRHLCPQLRAMWDAGHAANGRAFGDGFRAARLALGATMGDMARAMGVSVVAVADYEHGRDMPVEEPTISLNAGAKP